MVRRVLVWFHLSAGLVVCLYAVLIGISGAVLVFREELNALEFPQFHRGGLGPVAVTPDQALALVRQTYPGWRALSLTWPHRQTPYWMAYLLRGPDALEVYVDPAAPGIIGAHNPRQGWVNWPVRMHVNLLSGRVGRMINGYGAALLLFLAASGALLWFSSAAGWRTRLRLEPRSGWRKLSWQLHHSTGIAAAAFVAITAATGTWFVWTDQWIRAVSAVFERSQEPKLEPRDPDAPRLALADLAARAAEARPGLPIHRVALAQGPDQAVRFTLREGEPFEFHKVAAVWLDPRSGAVLRSGGSAQRPAGDSVLAWLSVLHFGIFGGWPVRILWAVLALAVPVLAVTGFLMWWRRVMEPRLRQPQPEAEEAAA